MSMFNSKRLSIGYLIVIIGLFLYSFTQIDLGLTLTRWSYWQVAQKFFQSIGYFNRPLSTVFYLMIIFSLFIFYFLFLLLASKKIVTKRQFWTLIITISVLLGFSYSAFSYDLFNYIFDAKIVTLYHQNPYIHKALDYPGDPMLSFMHWTHRIYPYGPIWLALTIPLSFLGFQFFLPTFFLFKALAVISFLGTVFYLGKILQKVSPENEVFSIVFFGLNPLVIIESLVSAHNDIVMIFLSMLSLYVLLNTQYLRSFILLVLSVGVKFATLFLLPIFVIIYFLQKKKKKLYWQVIFLLIVIFMTASIVFASLRTNFQPWYLLYVLPFAALISKKYYVLIPSIVISLFALLEYVPFLHTGNWDFPIPKILLWLITGSIILSTLLTFIWFLKSIGGKQGKVIK